MKGKGQVWFDKFLLSIDNEEIEPRKEITKPKISIKATLDKTFDSGSKIELSNLNYQQLINLELLGRVWGFLKYHHPSIGRGEYNWDYELFRILPTYLKSVNLVKRDEILLDWIKTLGVIPSCTNCKLTATNAILKPDLSWIMEQSEQIKETLLHVYFNRNQGEHYYIDQIKGIGNPKFLNELPYDNMNYPDDGFRLLSLYRYWNIVQYFYPYKHLINFNWNEKLKEYLPIFIKARNKLEYELAVLRLITEVKEI